MSLYFMLALNSIQHINLQCQVLYPKMIQSSYNDNGFIPTISPHKVCFGGMYQCPYFLIIFKDKSTKDRKEKQGIISC